MTADRPQDLINDLDDLLDAERAALLAGDLDRIPLLLDRKEDLIDRLNQIDEQGASLTVLHSKVLRNQALLDGALQGIRQASARLAEVRRVRRSLETYDEGGHKRTIEGEVLHKVEKRA